MWIFNLDGFFSVVEHRDHPEMVMVRARYREDIMTVAKKLDLFVEHTPKADYPYRAICNKKKWALYMSNSVEKINYDNFKNAALAGAGEMRAAQYHDVWATMSGQFGITLDYLDELAKEDNYEEERANLFGMQKADFEG
jgi:hypothetical protein